MLHQLSKYSAWFIFSTIITLYGVCFYHLFQQDSHPIELEWLTSLWHILQISTLQAGLSTLLSLAFGLLLARTFYYLDFKGKNLLYSVLSFTWVLPNIVIIFAVIGVWGNSGWLAQLFQWFGFHWHFQLYGLTGILIAHLLFNIPLASKYFLTQLQQISSTQHKLASQLNLTGLTRFRVVEFPVLKAVLPYLFSLIFILCFTSFAIVLMLGGGPKYSTLEVAIYQAVTFEFNFTKATVLAMVQIILGLSFYVCLNLCNRSQTFSTLALDQQQTYWKILPKGWRKLGLQATLLILSLWILLPLAQVVYSAFSVSHFWQRLQNPALWNATVTSLIICICTAFLVMLVSLTLLLELRQLQLKHQRVRMLLLESSFILPLIIPIFIITIGLFLLLLTTELTRFQLLIAVVIGNTLTILPYGISILYPAMWSTLNQYDRLARSLGLNSWQRWRIIEWALLKKPLKKLFVLASVLSLGNFTVIAFFGSAEFSTLPHLLYQQIGSYRTQDAAVTAFILLFFTFILFYFIESSREKYDRSKTR